MKAPVKYIIIGRFSRDGNGNPCISLSNDDLQYVDMEKEYIITIDGPCADTNHTQIKNNKRVKTIVRTMPTNTSVFS